MFVECETLFQNFKKNRRMEFYVNEIRRGKIFVLVGQKENGLVKKVSLQIQHKKVRIAGHI